MAKKPIIDIDINDEKFRQFYELFQKYQEGLEQTPGKFDEWNKVMAAGMGVVVDNTSHISKYLKEATKAQHQFQNATRKSGKALEGMRKDAKRISRELFGIGKFLLKGTGFGLGALGAGIFGIDRLATDAIQTQQRARSLGINTGQLRAWNINFSRFAPSDMLAKIAAEKGSTQGVAMLANAAGMNPESVATASTTQLAYRILMRLKEESKAWNPLAYQQMLQATGFSNAGITVADLRNLQAAGPHTLATARRSYERDKLIDQTGRSAVHSLWLFQRELHQTGKMLGTDLQQKLSALGPSLGQFIKALGGDARILLDDLLSKGNLEAMKKGISDFTNYLASGKLKASIETFGSSLGRLGDAVEYLANKIHPVAGYWSSFKYELHHRAVQLGGLLYSGKQFADRHPDLVAASRFIGSHANPLTGALNTDAAIKRAVTGAPSALARFWYNENPHTRINMDIAQGNAMRYASLFGAASRKYHLPPGLLMAMAMTESSGLQRARSNRGAVGIMQLEPDTASGLGVNPYDVGANISGGAHYIANMLADAKRFLPRGNLEQQVALATSMYNAGPGTLNKDIHEAMSKYGTSWMRHIAQYFSNETRSYAPTVFKALKHTIGQRSFTNIYIHSAIPARVFSQANGAAP